MPVVSVTGAQFTVKLATIAYTSQITSGTIAFANTVNQVKTLNDKVYYNADRESTLSLEYLFDDETAMYGAINTAAVAGTALAIEVIGGDTKFTGSLFVQSNDVTFAADGIATVSCSFMGTITVADAP